MRIPVRQLSGEEKILEVEAELTIRELKERLLRDLQVERSLDPLSAMLSEVDLLMAGEKLENLDETLENLAATRDLSTSCGLDMCFYLSPPIETASLLESGLAVEDLRAVQVPSGVERLDPHAFARCRSLVTVSLPDVQVLKVAAFSGCSSLLSVSIPSVIIIGPQAFKECTSLTTITLGAATTIGNQAFKNCSALTRIDLPDSVTYLWEEAFMGCKSLSNVTLSTSLQLINAFTFRACRLLPAIYIPPSVQKINYGAFCDCSALRDLSIPDSVKQIGPSCFRGCASLSQVTLSHGTSLEIDAFDPCVHVLHGAMPRASPAEACESRTQFRTGSS
ncbi:unnamed protein product [Durusdinium trenchii]|uniref:Ubiquitin-like domain-containing protein n=1 Tax=Durusdinium trenchii TaxID=1381693 RepID=A0ABP0N7C6_9DINO